MATVVQTVTNTGASSSVAVTVPNVQSGNKLVAFVFMDITNPSYNISLSDNKPNTYTKHLDNKASSTAGAAVFSTDTTVSGSVTLTATFSSASKYMVLTVLEISGLGAFQVVGGNTSPTLTPSITTAESGMIIGAFLFNDPQYTHTYTIGSGFTQQSNFVGVENLTNVNALIETNMTSAAGTYSANATITGNITFGKGANIIIGFKAAATGTAYTNSLSDSMSITDALTKSGSKNLLDSVSVTDTFTSSRGAATSYYAINQGTTRGEYLLLGSVITYNRIVLDMSFVNNTDYDFQDFYDDYGTPDEVYIAVQTSTGDFIYDNTSDTYTINGVANAPLPSANTRFTVDMTSSQTHTTTTVGGTTSFGRDGVNGRYATMKIYNVKYYNGATLVAHFDMSTGTFTDQTGNGNTLTSVGGNWDVPPSGGGTTSGIVTNGLLGYWNSKQGVNGATWNNIAPGTIGSYNAAITGAAINTYNGSTGMYFNGSTSTHVEIPVPTQLQSVTSATLEFRLNVNSTDSSLSGDILSGSSYLWYTLSQGIYFAGLFDNSRTDYQYGVANSYTDNTDNYITITVDSVTKTITLYVNGVQKGAYAPTTVGTMSDLTTLRLGNPDSDLDPPTMILDNVRMYNRVLTQAEISQNYGVGTEVGLTAVYTKSLSDSIASSDSITKFFSRFKNVSDSIGFSETITKSFSSKKTITDTLAPTDGISKQPIKTMIETLNLGDSIDRSKLGFSELLTVTDTIRKTIIRIRNDSVGLTENPSKFPTKSLSDAFALTDNVSKSNIKLLQEILTLSDGNSKATSRYKSLQDAFTLLDVLTARTSRFKSLSDSLSVTDSLTVRTSRFKSLQDTLSTGDSLVSSSIRYRILQDTFSVGDGTLKKTTAKSKNDALSFLDTVAKRINRTMIEAVFASDLVIKQSSHRLYDSLLFDEKLTFRFTEVLRKVRFDVEWNPVVHMYGEKQSTVLLQGEQLLSLQIQAHLKGGTHVTVTHQDFSMYTGDSLALAVNVYGENVNLIGCMATWILKKPNGPTIVTKTVADGGITVVGNTLTVHLLSNDTKLLSAGLYHQECKMVDTNENPSTLFVGEVELIESSIE